MKENFDDEVKTDNYNINKNKNNLEKQNQTKQAKNESTFLKPQNVISRKDEMIKYILAEETSSDDDVNADNDKRELSQNVLSRKDAIMKHILEGDISSDEDDEVKTDISNINNYNLPLNKNKQEKDKSTLLQLSKCNNDKKCI